MTLIPIVRAIVVASVPYSGLLIAVGNDGRCEPVTSVDLGSPAQAAGLHAGACIARARVNGTHWTSYCDAIGHAGPGDSLEVETSDGGSARLRLLECDGQQFDIDVFVMSSERPEVFKVPRHISVQELRQQIRTPSGCSMQVPLGCSTKSIDAAAMSDNQMLDSTCIRKVVIDCRTAEDDNDDIVLTFRDGRTVHMARGVGQMPPSALRCRRRPDDEHRFDCLGPKEGPER